jgi:tetratricopeptide (TPR) repeat protein
MGTEMLALNAVERRRMLTAMVRALVSSTVLLIASAWLSPHAFGQEVCEFDCYPRPSDWMDEARDAFERGDYERAFRLFEQRYMLSNRPPLLYNMAVCQERLGRYTDAIELYHRFLADGQPEDATRERVEARIRTLEREMARRPSGPPGVLRLESPAAQPDGSDELMIGSIISFSTGGAGLLVTAIAGSIALQRYSSLTSGCGASGSCTDAEIDELRTTALTADVALGIGVAGAAIGGVLLAIALTMEGDSHRTLRVAPTATPESGGILVQAAF